MKVIYLASGNDKLNYDNVDYQDLIIERDISGCMLDVDVTNYDILIATPPCNYWSRANYRRETSKYSQETKHLLPSIIDIFIKTEKPFIVENVRNKPLFDKYNLLNKNNVNIYYHGRHTYWTNIDIIDLLSKVEIPDISIQSTSRSRKTSREMSTKLIELIERDTPKKVEIGILKGFKLPICPNCKVELNEYYKNEYCKKCGQKLDWSDINE